MEKEQRNKKLENIKYVFENALPSMRIGTQFQRHMVMYQWPDIVGKEIAKHAKPVKMEHKKLFIYTTHPAWGDQLKYMAGDICAKINKHFHSSLVKELIFVNYNRAAEKAEELKIKDPYEDSLAEKIKRVQLSEDEQNQLNTACSQVENKDLQQVLARCGANLKRLNKYRQQNGWHTCATDGCQSLCEPAEKYCQGCQRDRRNAKKKHLQQQFIELPWVSYKEMNDIVPCTQEEYTEARTTTLRRLSEQVYYGDTESIEAKTLVMLYRSLPPEQLSEEVMTKTMRALSYDVKYRFLDESKSSDGKAKEDG